MWKYMEFFLHGMKLRKSCLQNGFLRYWCNECGMDMWHYVYDFAFGQVRMM